MNDYLFYKLGPNVREVSKSLDDPDLEAVWWQPGKGERRPVGFSIYPFLIWWLFGRLGIFSAPSYGIAIIRSNAKCIHRTCVFPKFFRFPFMNAEDIQLGDIWTDEQFRGKGLAKIGVELAIRNGMGDKSQVWYICEKSNVASQKLAERIGFEFKGIGTRHTLFGIGLLGYYKMDDA